MTMSESERIDDAKRKARYGHRDWIYWRDRAGTLHVGLQTPGNVKQALLDIGTQGRFIQIGRNTACSFIMRWRTGLNLLAWSKYEDITRL